MSARHFNNCTDCSKDQESAQTAAQQVPQIGRSKSAAAAAWRIRHLQLLKTAAFRPATSAVPTSSSDEHRRPARGQVKRAIIVWHASRRHYWLPHEHWLSLSGAPAVCTQESRCPFQHGVRFSQRVQSPSFLPSSAPQHQPWLLSRPCDVNWASFTWPQGDGHYHIPCSCATRACLSAVKLEHSGCSSLGQLPLRCSQVGRDCGW